MPRQEKQAPISEALSGSQDSTKEFLSILREFSRVREGTLLRVRRTKTLLQLTHVAESFSQASKFNFTELQKNDLVLLYKIESTAVDRVQFVWKDSASQDSDESVIEYQSRRRQPLDTVTFYFLSQQNEEVRKCHLVLCNETMNSLRLFFSMFEIVCDGIEESPRPSPWGD